MSQSEAEQLLSHYIDCPTSKQASDCTKRVKCPTCNASRSFYCATCLELLVPKDEWPQGVKDNALKLPFDVDLILDDRRLSSTGIQMATLLKASSSPTQIRISDRDLEEPVPDYSNELDETFLLFPCPSSVPLSYALKDTSRVRRLVILDCKWRRSSIRLHPNLTTLKRVHLDNPPAESFYWRWHNSGDGMLSTVEAVYYAAWQVGAATKGWDFAQPKLLVDLFWLFRLQREIIRYEYNSGSFNELPVPFSEDGKEYQRSLRRKGVLTDEP